MQMIDLRQYRTKSVWRLCTPSACKFPVIFHKNAREYIKYSLRFLFHLTKKFNDASVAQSLCGIALIIALPVGNVKGDPILTNFHQQEFSRAASRLKKQVTGICR